VGARKVTPELLWDPVYLCLPAVHSLCASGADLRSSVLLRDPSPETIQHLIVRYRPLLRRLVEHHVPMHLSAKLDGSDLVQQTCLDAVRGASGVKARTRKQFLAWLQQLLRNNIRMANRRFLATSKRDVRREVALGEGMNEISLPIALADPMRSPDEIAMWGEAAKRLEESMNQLPLGVRTVLELHYIHGKSFVDIGSTVGRSADAVRMLETRALERLRKEVFRDESWI